MNHDNPYLTGVSDTLSAFRSFAAAAEADGGLSESQVRAMIALIDAVEGGMGKVHA